MPGAKNAFQQRLMIRNEHHKSKILSEHSGPSSSSSSSSSQLANMNSLEVRGHGAVQENPRSALSPLTNSLLEQLEARIKDLKGWLRDTELLIFNSCLGRETDAKEQLHSFKRCSLGVEGEQNRSSDSERNQNTEQRQKEEKKVIKKEKV
ncbi:hypothetical protein F7725_008647 [Dissostichus mawsoni]|uniref:Uncharacterized protein n=1 Tax=Dissostichus mawsoni TaxID=36200 RepID=A0A7J5Y7S0_DISMA|nr:hypothetical protein F7725_008647 [Dissostichus mawsoni]